MKLYKVIGCGMCEHIVVDESYASAVNEDEIHTYEKVDEEEAIVILLSGKKVLSDVDPLPENYEEDYIA